MSASVPPYVSTLSKYPVKESAFFRGGPVFVMGLFLTVFVFMIFVLLLVMLRPVFPHVKLNATAIVFPSEGGSLG